MNQDDKSTEFQVCSSTLLFGVTLYNKDNRRGNLNKEASAKSLAPTLDRTKGILLKSSLSVIKKILGRFGNLSFVSKG